MEVNFKTIIKKSVNIDFQKIFDFIVNEMGGYDKPIDIANRFAYRFIFYPCLTRRGLNIHLFLCRF